jgi:hypothetical protein
MANNSLILYLMDKAILYRLEQALGVPEAIGSQI